MHDVFTSFNNGECRSVAGVIDPSVLRSRHFLELPG